MKKIIIAIAAVSLLASCGGEQKVKEEPKQEAAEKVCSYSYNNESTEIYWTAYKHTAKVGVGGKFESFTSEGGTDATSVEEALKGLSISIDPTSVNSKDSIRDGKLVSFFFGKMGETAPISGVIESIEGGSGSLKMNMNNTEVSVPFAYTNEDGKVELKATIDILSFGADEAFSTLGDACAEKHTGGDGEKKFWSEVDIFISTKLNKSCE